MAFTAPHHELTQSIIRCAIEVHRVIGPGLKEEVYEAALVLNFGRITLKEGIARVVNETKAEYRTRLLHEDPVAFRNLLIEEEGVTLDVANRMQLAGDIGLYREGSGEPPPVSCLYTS